MNKNKIGLVIGGVIVLGAVFYGGMVYGKSQIPQRVPGGQGGMQFSGSGRGGRNAGGFTVGKIIAEDAKSITVQLTSGGSKIIFLDTTTKISRFVDGTIGDLTVGTEVSINGAPNTDGSINAQTVQIRPNIPTTTTVVQ